MIGFIKGKVHAFGKDYVIVDTGSIGYRINFNRPELLKKDAEVTIYTYQHVREDEISLFGFMSLKEYDLFIKLISVKGLGPKIASGILAFGGVDKIIEAIETKDIAYIKSLPGIGAKTASQMILDLKGKLPESQESMIENPKLNDVIDALKALGYRQNEINPVINKIKGEDLSVDEYIKKALALMLKQR